MSKSGYRNVHREQILDIETPIWQVRATMLSRSASEWTMLVAAADGIVRMFRVREKTVSDKLDASALMITCTHALLGISQVFPPLSETRIGCCQSQLVRNYVGEDKMAGDVVVVAMEITGTMRVWIVEDDQASNEVPAILQQVRPQQEFVIKEATGTLMAVCPPNHTKDGNLTAAVACLDGSIAIVALGVATPKAKKEASTAGSVIYRLGTGSTPLSLCWHPSDLTIAVGRADGLVELMKSTGKSHYRLTYHSEPVRAIEFTPDGSFLVTCSDGGDLSVWDVVGVKKTLVHQLANAHASWVLGICVMTDSRRFVTSGADGKIHVWQFDALHAPTHTFHNDQNNWTISLTQHKEPQRLVSGSDMGLVQVFSLDE